VCLVLSISKECFCHRAACTTRSRLHGYLATIDHRQMCDTGGFRGHISRTYHSTPTHTYLLTNYNQWSNFYHPHCWDFQAERRFASKTKALLLIHREEKKRVIDVVQRSSRHSRVMILDCCFSEYSSTVPSPLFRRVSLSR
jgi:hypothetical protein